MPTNRIHIIFPPMFSPYQPYTSIPSLAAATHKAGVHLHAIDLNIIAHEAFLSPNYLYKSLEKALKNDRLTPTCLRDIGLEIDRIEQNLQVIRGNGEDVSAESYLSAIRSINRALKAVGAAHGRTSVCLGSARMPYSPQSSTHIMKAIRDELSNPFIPIFRQQIEKTRNEFENVSLLGVSLICLGQVIPAFTYLALFRERFPDIPVVIGGPVLSRIERKFPRCSEIQEFFDFVVLGAGETALIELASQLDGKRDFSEVPNLLYSDNSGMVRSRLTHIEDLDAWPTIRYDIMPINKYFSPKLLLTVPVARGCYWKKCTFCNQHVVSRGGFCQRDPSLVLEDISWLACKHDTDLFCLGTEGLHPKYGEQIAERLISAGLEISWYAGSRLDDRLDYSVIRKYRESGCKQLMLGLESGSQRILDSMKKGIRIEHARDVIRLCHRLGVGVHLFLMTGFPGEEISDIEATSELLKDILSLSPMHVSVKLSKFQVVDGSQISLDPKSFGCFIPSRHNQGDLSYILPFKYNHSQQVELSWARKEYENVINSSGAANFSYLPTTYRMAICAGLT